MLCGMMADKDRGVVGRAVVNDEPSPRSPSLAQDSLDGTLEGKRRFVLGRSQQHIARVRSRTRRPTSWSVMLIAGRSTIVRTRRCAAPSVLALSW